MPEWEDELDEDIPADRAQRRARVDERVGRRKVDVPGYEQYRGTMWPEQRARAEALKIVAESTKRLGVASVVAKQSAEMSLLPDDLVRLANYIVTGHHESLGEITTVELGDKQGGLKFSRADSGGHVGIVIDPEGVAEWFDDVQRENDLLREHNATLVDRLATEMEKTRAQEHDQEMAAAGFDKDVDQALSVANTESDQIPEQVADEAVGFQETGELYVAPMGTDPNDRVAWIPLGSTPTGVQVQSFLSDGSVNFEVAEQTDPYSKSGLERVFSGNAESFQRWIDSGRPRPTAVSDDEAPTEPMGKITGDEAPTVAMEPAKTDLPIHG